MRSSGLPIGFNYAAARVQNLTGKRLDPYMPFHFAIEIEGLLSGGFSEVSGLESHVEVDSHHEGGVNDFVHQFPKQATHANLILKHGLTDISTLWNWYYNVTQGVIERKNGTIMLLDADLLPIMWWNFRNAFPVKWVGPTFNAAEQSAIAFEEVELVHEGLTKPLIAQGVAVGRGIAKLAGGL